MYALYENTTRRLPENQLDTSFSVERVTADGAYTTKLLDNKECYRCGGRGHHPIACKFKSQKCNFCKGQGHTNRVYRKQSEQDEFKNGIATIRATAKGKTQSTHPFDEDTVSVVFPQNLERAESR